MDISFYLFILWLIDIWVVFCLGLLWLVLLWPVFCTWFLCEHRYAFLLGIYIQEWNYHVLDFEICQVSVDIDKGSFKKLYKFQFQLAEWIFRLLQMFAYPWYHWLFICFHFGPILYYCTVVLSLFPRKPIKLSTFANKPG